MVIGGTHVTLVPDEVEPAGPMSIAVGEGYRTWPQIIRDFDARHAPDRATWMRSGRRSIRAWRCCRIGCWQQVDEHRNYWTPYLEITRGCPRSCTFCTAIRVSGRKMRLRPVDEVVEEIERRKLRRFFLTDDNFGLNFRLFPEYMEQLFRALAKLPLHGWTCQAEQMVAEYPDLLDLAREAHLDKFFIGFESINPGNRKELGGKARGDVVKLRRGDQARSTSTASAWSGCSSSASTATPRRPSDAAWDFIRSSELDGVSATILTPYPGTVQREELLAAGPHPPARHVGAVRHQPRHLRAGADDRGGAAGRLRLAVPPHLPARRASRSAACAPGGAIRCTRMPSRLFSSFSTDIGYRREFNHR